MEKVKSSRECLSCTACCDGWLQISVFLETVCPGHPCTHRTADGCGIYENRPTNPCKIFKCGWLIDNSPLPDWMRPSDSKVIFLFNKYSWKNQHVDNAISTGEEIPSTTIDWLKNFTLQNKRLLLITEQKYMGKNNPLRTKIIVFGTDEFRKSIGDLVRNSKLFLDGKILG